MVLGRSRTFSLVLQLLFFSYILKKNFFSVVTTKKYKKTLSKTTQKIKNNNNFFLPPGVTSQRMLVQRNGHPRNSPRFGLLARAVQTWQGQLRHGGQREHQPKWVVTSQCDVNEIKIIFIYQLKDCYNNYKFQIFK